VPAGFAVEVLDLVKRYPKGKVNAVDGVSFAASPGEVFGLLGPNGAGKTTTVGMLTTRVRPTSGTARIVGVDVVGDPVTARQQLAVVPQRSNLDRSISIRDNLIFHAAYHGVPAREREERADELLDQFGLLDRAREKPDFFSGGQSQRVMIARALMHEPRVLFLDEPTSGVDPIARRAFWAMINQLADQGAAILVTTHYLEEAEQCNRLGFMVAGELVAEGTPSGVKAAQGGRVLEIYADEPLRAVALLKTAMEPWRVSLFGDRLHVIVDGDAPAAARELTARLAREGIRVLDAREEDYSLEDVFLVIAEKGAVAA